MKLTRQVLFAWIAGIGASDLALATLPPPTPEQAKAAAEKKAQADAQAAKDKQELLASMDEVTKRWRTRMAAQGKPVPPPVPVASQTAAVTMPAAGAGPAGQPGGKLGPAAKEAPVRSEKAGNAPPSEDVKKKP